MRGLDPTSDLWDYVLTFLPANLEELGRSHGVVRLREFKRISDLLRSILAWGQPGGSFSTASAWARVSGVADISAEGLFYRVKNSEPLLEAVMGSLLHHWRGIKTDRRLVLVDATVLCGPGATGANWRVHMLYDPCRAVPCGVEVTDAHGGETFARHDLRPGDLVIGDRGYGHFRGFIAALVKKADVLVRIEPGQMKLTDLKGGKVSLRKLDLEIPTIGAKSFDLVWHGPEKDCRKVRIIGARTRKGDVCWLATNMGESEMPATEAANLYGLRWQIELLFKRMKSLMSLNELRSREGPTARAFIFAKLITAFLALRLCDDSEAFSPYGYDIQRTGEKSQLVATVPVRVERAHCKRSGGGQMDFRSQMEGVAA